jgi:hypothetical protein
MDTRRFRGTQGPWLVVRRDSAHAATPGDRGVLLHQRLEDAGVDTDRVLADQPDLFRQLARSCSGCADKGKCSHDIASGEFNERAAAYCPNTARIAGLTMTEPEDEPAAAWVKA